MLLKDAGSERVLVMWLLVKLCLNCAMLSVTACNSVSDVDSRLASILTDSEAVLQAKCDFKRKTAVLRF